jgi:coenzyme F420-0:L-glutamate ligase / coenzyme F420-1:gamma-L-glutamate ligase
MKSQDLLLRPLRSIPAIAAGDDLVELILRSISSMNDALQDGDVLVVTQKIVSKVQGRVVDLASVVASAEAIELAQKTNKDPRLVELILRESSEVVRAVPGLIVVAHRLGLVLANAGIDRSNSSGSEVVLLLPEDPDGSAEDIRSGILAKTGRNVGVVIIDSIGRAWRMGTVGTAIGVSGMPALLDLRGSPDLNGRPLESTEIGLADELAAAASLMMGQANEGTPVVLARGVPYDRYPGKATDLVRAKKNDLFR